MMKLVFTALLCTVSVLAQRDVQSRMYIAPMEGGLDGFIAAEIVKQHLPVVVSSDENDAEYILTGASLKEDDHWYNAVWGGKDKNEGNVRLIHVKTKEMVWAAEAGDRSIFFSNWRRGGERKIAQRIASRMKKDYFDNANPGSITRAASRVKSALFGKNPALAF